MTVEALKTDLAALESRRVEIAQEIAVARSKEAGARDAIILAPSAEAREEMRAAAIEADSLENVAKEIERRIEAVTEELGKARQNAARGAALVELQQRAAAWEQSQEAARLLTEELAAVVAKAPGLLSETYDLVGAAAQISKEAALHGIGERELPALERIKRTSVLTIFIFLSENVSEQTTKDDLELLLQAASKRERMRQSREIYAQNRRDLEAVSSHVKADKAAVTAAPSPNKNKESTSAFLA